MKPADVRRPAKTARTDEHTLAALVAFGLSHTRWAQLALILDDPKRRAAFLRGLRQLLDDDRARASLLVAQVRRTFLAPATMHEGTSQPVASAASDREALGRIARELEAVTRRFEDVSRQWGEHLALIAGLRCA